MTSREALASKAFPKSIIILGAGAIGVEFAYFSLQRLRLQGDACRDAPADPARPEDEEVSKTLQRSFEKQIVQHVGTHGARTVRVGEDLREGRPRGRRDEEHHRGRGRPFPPSGSSRTPGRRPGPRGSSRSSRSVWLPEGGRRLPDGSIIGIYGARDIIEAPRSSPTWPPTRPSAP